MPPTADFSGTPASGDAPLAVTFTDLSTAGTSPITARSWAFGDGGTSTATNPGHTYTLPGTYTVALTVTTADGVDTESKPNYITVSAPPVPPTAEFSGTPTSGDAPLAVTFTDLSTAGTSAITARSWDFGDGGTSTATNPSHTYTTPGTYTVELTVTTADGVDTESKTDYIEAVAVAPTAAFSGTPTSGAVPFDVAFTDESTAGSSAITARSWDFGDGSTSTATNPVHTYTDPGTWTVALTVTTADGVDTESKTDYIQASPPPAPPTVGLNAFPYDGIVPLSVDFTDQSLDGGSPITSWAWSFGDGGTSTEQNPSHTYTAVGSYSVSLTVTNAVGTASVTVPDLISVLPVPVPPTADFSGTPTSGDAPLEVTFTDLSTAGSKPITDWLWDFGDTTTSAAANPTHTYAGPGTYTVALSVETEDGDDTQIKTAYIVVSPVAPTAEFSGTPTSGDTPLEVTFTDESTAGTSPITTYLWDFGDGTTTSIETDPTHTYAGAGDYTVVLTVTTADGTDTETKTAYIHAAAPSP